METRIFVKIICDKLIIREVIITDIKELTGLDQNKKIEKILANNSDWKIELSNRYDILGYFPDLVNNNLDSGFVTGYPEETSMQLNHNSELNPYQIAFEKFYGTGVYLLDSKDDLRASHQLFLLKLKEDKDSIRNLFTSIE